jgi:hypothetical protein
MKRQSPSGSRIYLGGVAVIPRAEEFSTRRKLPSSDQGEGSERSRGVRVERTPGLSCFEWNALPGLSCPSMVSYFNLAKRIRGSALNSSFGLGLEQFGQLSISLGAPCLLQFDQIYGAALCRILLKPLPVRESLLDPRFLIRLKRRRVRECRYDPLQHLPDPRFLILNHFPNDDSVQYESISAEGSTRITVSPRP